MDIFGVKRATCTQWNKTNNCNNTLNCQTDLKNNSSTLYQYNILDGKISNK